MQIWLRDILMSLSCFAQNKQCLEQARKQFQKWKQSTDRFKTNTIPVDYQITFMAFGIASGTSEEIEQNAEFVEEVFMSYYSTEGDMLRPLGNSLEMSYALRLKDGLLLAKKVLAKISPNITFPSSVPFR